MQVKDELRVLVEAETARAIENFKKLSEGVDDSEKKTLSLGEALDSLSNKSLIISGALGGAGIAAVKFAGENEKLKLSLKNMLGDAEEAASVFEDWRRLGTSPGLSADEVFSLGRAMVNMGQDTQYATTTIQMLGDIAAGTGVSFGEISSSFERARAMGNLTTRDLVRLQQQGIPIVKQLAKELGKSEENIRLLAAEGKIGFAELERAFRSMTSPGGQFAGMMNELSGTVLEKFSNAADDAKQALASFGEIMLPIATDLLNCASSVLQGITGMDDGTKRFVIGMGAVIAASGPLIMAVKAVSAAMTLAAANPYILAIGATIAAVSVVAGFINKQANAYDDLQKKIRETDSAARDMLQSYANGNEEKVLDEKTTRELVKLYPELTSVIRANNTTVREALDIQRRLNEQRIIDSQEARIRRLQRDQAELTAALREIDQLEEEMRNPGPGYSVDALNRMMEDNIEYRDSLMRRIYSQQEEINTVLSSIGRQFTLGGEIIDIPVTVTFNTASFEENILTVADAKKTWQEWFGEITKIDPALFGNSAARAAELYLAEFGRGLSAQTTIAEALGEQLDLSGILRSRQADVKNALAELFAIDPEQIDRPFTLANEAVTRLVDEYRRLGEKAKKAEFNKTIEDLAKKIDDLGKSERQLAYEAELARLGMEAQSDAGRELAQTLNRLSVASALSDLSREVQNLGKDQYDLALETMAAANATEEEMKQALEMIETLREAKQAVDDLGGSFEEFLSKKIAGGLMDLFPELEKQAIETIANIQVQLAMISFDSILDGFGVLGEAFAKGESAAESLRQALADMAQQILDQLPSMFLQAGLQLIAQGQWALGLGLVAAAGSSAIVGGYVRGTIDREKAAANAHGNAFDSNGIIPYAHGGSFTNQIISKPTYFRYGGNFGVMGEAGPESIMPLRRMANGDLGVAASGGEGANVTVNIINNSGADVQKEERTDAEGNKQIDVIIGQLVNNHIASGKADRAMSRYGLRASGV